MKLIIYTDGGSRGNPGPSAIGVVIRNTTTKQDIKEYSEYIGKSTNNIAEYSALIFAIKKVKKLVGKKNTKNTEIEIRSDSELMVRQLNGQYKLKNDIIQKLFIDVWNLKTEFKNISFKYIPREKNKVADMLVNKELDSKQTMF